MLTCYFECLTSLTADGAGSETGEQRHLLAGQLGQQSEDEEKNEGGHLAHDAQDGECLAHSEERCSGRHSLKVL